MEIDVFMLHKQACLVFKTVGSGDSLFSSIAHQLFSYDMGSVMHEAMTCTVREMIVEYALLNSHNEELQFAILMHVRDAYPVLQNADPLVTVGNFLRLLARKGTWGVFN